MGEENRPGEEWRETAYRKAPPLSTSKQSSEFNRAVKRGLKTAGLGMLRTHSHNHPARRWHSPNSTDEKPAPSHMPRKTQAKGLPWEWTQLCPPPKAKLPLHYALAPRCRAKSHPPEA